MGILRIIGDTFLKREKYEHLTEENRSKILGELTNDFSSYVQKFGNKERLVKVYLDEIFDKFKSKTEELKAYGIRESETQKLEKMLFDLCKDIDNDTMIKYFQKIPEWRLSMKYLRYLFSEKNITSFSFYQKKLCVCIDDKATFPVKNNKIQDSMMGSDGNSYKIKTFFASDFPVNSVITEIDGKEKKFPVFLDKEKNEWIISFKK